MIKRISIIILGICLFLTACVANTEKSSREQVNSKESENTMTESEGKMQIGETTLIPKNYYTEAKDKGKVVKLEYDTYNYSDSMEEITKPAYIYIPYGYDENNKETKYDTLYLMHGWTGVAGDFFQYGYSQLKNILDNMIENGDIKPVIVITPTFDPNNESNSFSNSVNEIAVFHNELVNELIPAVDSEFNAYEDREHRAFGGFSLGAVTTWYSFVYNLDKFKYYLPMSGDCWILGTYGGRYKPKETAEYIAEVVDKSGYGHKDFFIYSATGSNDAVFEQVDNQMQAMLKMPDDFTADNFVYKIKPGGVHDFSAVMEYIYNALPIFFPANK